MVGGDQARRMLDGGRVSSGGGVMLPWSGRGATAEVVGEGKQTRQVDVEGEGHGEMGVCRNGGSMVR